MPLLFTETPKTTRSRDQKPSGCVLTIHPEGNTPQESLCAVWEAKSGVSTGRFAKRFVGRVSSNIDLKASFTVGDPSPPDIYNQLTDFASVGYSTEGG